MTISVLDFETCLIEPAKQAPRAVCLVTDAAGHDELLHCWFDRDAVRDRLFRAFTQGYVVGAYTAYDACVAIVDMPELAEVIWAAYDALHVLDVQINEKLIDLAHGRLGGRPGPNGWERVAYSLGDIVARRFGRTMEKGPDGWRLRYGTLYGTPVTQWPKEAVDYPLGDLRETRETLHAQLREPPQCLVDAARQARASFWLTLVSARGFALDRQWIERLDADLTAEERRIVGELAPLGLVKQERDGSWTRDTKAAGARLAQVWPQGAGPVPQTADGKIELTKESCKDAKDPILASYSRLSEIIATQAKVESLKDAAIAGKPIQSRFDSLLESGRVSVSGGRITKKADLANRTSYGFQIQNVKREPGLRECFVARQGYFLWSIDYGQLELCTWAQACQDLFGFSELGKMLNAKIDVHSKMGAMIFGLDYEWVVANKKTDQKAKDARQAGKPFVFGKPGGMGAKGIIGYAKTQYGVVLTEEEAQQYGDAWKRLFPEHKPYFAYVHRCLEQDGCIVQLRSGRIRGDQSFTALANTLFQGLAADVAKAAGYEVARAAYTGRDSRGQRYPALHGSYLVNFVHDEIIGESPEDRASEAALEAADIMRRIAREWLPDVPPDAEPALMRRWYKDAGLVKGSDGRLAPWEPKEKGNAG